MILTPQPVYADIRDNADALLMEEVPFISLPRIGDKITMRDADSLPRKVLDVDWHVHDGRNKIVFAFIIVEALD